MSTHHDLPVVVGCDGSFPSLDAVRWAAAYAAERKAPLRIVYAIGMAAEFGLRAPYAPVDDEYERAEGEAVLADARVAAESVGEPGLGGDIGTELVRAAAIPALLDRAEHARLVVSGTRGHGAFLRGLLGSTSSALARHARCPVAVVPGPGQDSGPVVVGVDGSRHSALAIEIAFDEAEQHGAELVVVHGWSEVFRYAPRTELQREGELVVSESIAGYGERYPEVKVRRVVVEERPARRLLSEGERARLIVVGSHGRGGFPGMTLGSVAQAVVHGATVPVIVAREPS
ncbi:universal stress protein [Nocardia puris]|nr:universal stress protein [Nocardia puris]MBF6209711.1 universal stress protein [Nocardia puris]MBF6366283.1 universal stress protein [Nocardia puris]MBF6458378.1 universal stress protein [Nocardia puris]